jgi:hypothetical protein
MVTFCLLGNLFPIFVGRKMKMGKILPSQIDETKLGTNPFLGGLVVKVLEGKSGYVVDEDGVMVDNVVEMECETFAKVFDKPENRIVMAGLSFRALQVWTWSMYTVLSGKDYIWVNVERLMKECHIKSVKTYRAAMNELCRYGYIAPCVGHKNVYWINPSLGFKGSRVNKFPKNVLRIKRGE